MVSKEEAKTKEGLKAGTAKGTMISLAYVARVLAFVGRPARTGGPGLKSEAGRPSSTIYLLVTRGKNRFTDNFFLAYGLLVRVGGMV